MQPGTKRQAEVHLRKPKTNGNKKSKWHANVLFIFIVPVAAISAVNVLKGSSQFLLTSQQWELLLAQVSVISSCHWLSVESSGGFSVRLAHHPVGIRTVQYRVRVSLQMFKCLMSDDDCLADQTRVFVLLYCCAKTITGTGSYWCLFLEFWKSISSRALLAKMTLFWWITSVKLAHGA